MDENSIRRIMSLLDLPEPSVGNGWLNTTCPLAPWKHGGGIDQRPSFGVSINDEGSSVYYCFGCMSDVKPLHGLLQALFVLSGRYPSALAKIYIGCEVFKDSDRVHVHEIWNGCGVVEDTPPISAEVLAKFPLLCHARGEDPRMIRLWMEQDRGIPVVVQNRWRLRYDRERFAVMFPMTDHRGRIFLIRERKCRTKNIWTLTPKLAGCPDLKFPRLKHVGAWFGLPYVDWDSPVMLVEGEFDVMRIYALGFTNVIGSSTSSVTDAQIDSLRGDSYILGYDDDIAGRHACARIKDRIGRKALVQTARWGVVGKKDGGDLENEDQLSQVLHRLE